MSHTAWRIALQNAKYNADDLSGKGAEKTGGRWNHLGHAMLYTSASPSTACVETLVHLNAGGLPVTRYLVRIDIPDDVWTAATQASGRALPADRDAQPAGNASMAFGTDWLRSRRSALLIVPSVVVPEETNILINPAHPDAASITAQKERLWTYDPRLLK